jgi:WD40 repeat protein
MFGALFSRSVEQVQLFDLRDMAAVRTEHHKSTITLSWPSESSVSVYNSGSFSPDGLFYALGDEHALRIWDVRQTSQPVSNLLYSDSAKSPAVQVVWESPRNINLLHKKGISFWRP